MDPKSISESAENAQVANVTVPLTGTFTVAVDAHNENEQNENKIINFFTHQPQSY